jgi:predicted phage terminase large subunit-like protein
MQRIHEGDFTAELMSDESEQFKQIKLKALRDDGTALWYLKHSAEDLENMKSKNLFVFATQYQQEPTAKGGSIFKAHWWRYYTSLPYLLDRVIIVGDTAMKIKEENDYSVFQLWALAENKIFLVDQIRGKWEAPQLKTMAVAFAQKCKKMYSQLDSFYIEDKASGTGLIQSLPSEIRLPIIPIPRIKGQDKVSRAYDAALFVEAGMVHLPTGEGFTDLFLSECTSFNEQMTHLHDDQVDPMMDATKILLGGSDLTMFDVL